MKLPCGLLVLTGALLIMPAGLVLSRAQQAGSKPAAEARTGRVDPADLVTQALGLVEAVVPVRGAEGWTIHPIIDIAAARARMGDRAGSAAAFEEALKCARAVASPGLRAARFEKSPSVWPGPARQKSLWNWPWNRKRMSRDSDSSFRSHLLSEIATELARAGKLELAKRAVEQVSDSSARNERADGDRPGPGEAIRPSLGTSIVDKIDDSGMRVRALAGPLFDGAGIAWIRDTAGDKKGAGLAFNKAISIVGTMPQSEEKDYAMASLAIARARLRDVSSGLEQAKGLKEERARSLAQGAIAEILAANGDWDAALQTANAVVDPALKARALCQIGNAQSKAGKRDAALETLQKALDANSRHNRIEDYSIAIGLARAGGIKAALGIVDAMAARDQSPDPILLADLAAIEAQAGDFPAARTNRRNDHRSGGGGCCLGKDREGPGRSRPRGRSPTVGRVAQGSSPSLACPPGCLAEGLAARRQRETQQKP